MRGDRPSLRLARRGGRHVLLLAVMLTAGLLRAGDWPMLGRDKTRNPVSAEKGAPFEWDLMTGRNIKWRAPWDGMRWATR